MRALGSVRQFAEQLRANHDSKSADSLDAGKEHAPGMVAAR
jgi:hypothetical protein